MGKVQKVYSKEFKQEAVRLVETSGKSIAQIARELHDVLPVLVRHHLADRRFGSGLLAANARLAEQPRIAVAV